MKKYIIKRVFRGEQETKFGIMPKLSLILDSQEFLDKNGKPAWISCIGKGVKGTESWKDGDEVELEIVKKGDFFNFVRDTNAGLMSKIQELESRVSALEAKIK